MTEVLTGHQGEAVFLGRRCSSDKEDDSVEGISRPAYGLRSCWAFWLRQKHTLESPKSSHD